MKQSILKEKSKDFALRIIKMAEYIQTTKKEYVLSKQALRSGTSIANVYEAFFGQSLPDFISKLSIARKECAETEYWLDLLCESGKIERNEYDSIAKDCEELGKMLTSSINTCLKKLPTKEKANSTTTSLNESVSEPIQEYVESPLTHYNLVLKRHEAEI